MYQASPSFLFTILLFYPCCEDMKKRKGVVENGIGLLWLIGRNEGERTHTIEEEAELTFWQLYVYFVSIPIMIVGCLFTYIYIF